MKTTAIAIALLMGGAAFAQTGTTTAQPDHSKMDHSKMDPSKMDPAKMDHSKMDHSKMDHSKMDHSKMDPAKMDHSKMDHSKMEHSPRNMSTMNQPSANQSTMNHSAMNHSAASSMSGTMIQPGNAAPERDARGIPVISAPAFVPAGWNGAVGPAVGGPLVDASTGDPVDANAVYPACTAQITDNCVQAYEVGRRR